MSLANIAIQCLSHSASSPCKQRESKYADSICLMILLAHFCYLRTASEHSWLNGGIKSLITMQLDKKNKTIPPTPRESSNKLHGYKKVLKRDWKKADTTYSDRIQKIVQSHSWVTRKD